MPVWTVSQLNREARDVLERDFSAIDVEGEISDLIQHRSGHWYFTLKDDDAQLRAAMFRFQNRKVRFTPENGQQVIVSGRVSLYEARGSYQLIAERIQPAGLGKLQRQFEALKQRLQNQGWFDSARKRPLPSAVSRIAIITSPQGAALHDICTTFKRRCPAIELIVVPVPVQGDGAAPKIAAALDNINALAVDSEHAATLRPDAIVLARGGGSLEDLWAFNEEVVAAAIHRSTLPVVSAVGHETDTSIADWVADVRAPTPTAAAELLSPSSVQLTMSVQQLYQRLQQHIATQIRHRRLELAAQRAKLLHPQHQLAQLAQQFDHLESRALRAVRDRQRHAISRLKAARLLLNHTDPRQRLAANRRDLTLISQRMRRGIHDALQQQRQRLAFSTSGLQVVSPLATLARGYSITRGERGELVADPTQVHIGEHISTRVSGGEIYSSVIGTGASPSTAKPSRTKRKREG